jgi:hypothetical protein
VLPFENRGRGDEDEYFSDGISEDITSALVKLERLRVAPRSVAFQFKGKRPTPEYNNSVPPLLKNAIDWISRVESTGTIKYRNRVYGIGSTSDGMIGGARALIDLRRIVLTAVGAILIPNKIEVSRAQEAFDHAGELPDAPARLLKRLCHHLVELAGRLAD